MMRLSAFILVMLLCVPVGSLLASVSVEEGCPVGLVCHTKVEWAELVVFSISEWSEIRERMIDLEEKEGLLRARKLSLLGSSVGCGGGVAFNDETNAALFCGYLWGFRW